MVGNTSSSAAGSSGPRAGTPLELRVHGNTPAWMGGHRVLGWVADSQRSRQQPTCDCLLALTSRSVMGAVWPCTVSGSCGYTIVADTPAGNHVSRKGCLQLQVVEVGLMCTWFDLSTRLATKCVWSSSRSQLNSIMLGASPQTAIALLGPDLV